MDVFVTCSKCGDRDHPRSVRIPTYPEMQQGANMAWAPPEGWTDYPTSRGSFTVCRRCNPEIEYAIAQAMNPPRGKTE